MGPKPLILLHAEGDEQIPGDFSSELYERAAEPRKLIIVPGGHHRSVQHDAELQGVALRWIERALAGATEPVLLRPKELQGAAGGLHDLPPTGGSARCPGSSAA